MRCSDNIFETDRSRETALCLDSPAAITTVILTVASVIGAIAVIANFDEILAKIAIWVAGLITSAIPVVLLILLIMYILAKLKWKLFGPF